MTQNRRDFLATLGAAGATCLLPRPSLAADQPANKHIITLSFDDGFRKSFTRTAEIYEKHKLSACLNVVVDWSVNDKYVPKSSLGDFTLWNELKKRGHEIMPHGYGHEGLANIPFEKGKDLIRRCLEAFTTKLDGFDQHKAVFNFPGNSSSPELEQWLPTQVRAFRARGASAGVNPLPHRGLVKLTTRGFGPGNGEEALDRAIEMFLAKPSGWLIYNCHGLDDEGWGPIRASYLERLLDRLGAINSVELMPAGAALAKYGAQ